MYHIEFTKKSKEQLLKLLLSDSRMILRKLYSLKENPFPFLKKLKGNKLWRLRITKFRVIIDVVISSKTMVVLRIVKRDKVYD